MKFNQIKTTKTTALAVICIVMGMGMGMVMGIQQQQSSVLAFSNKYSSQERYDSGVRDGTKDCNNGSDTASYQQSGAYLGHSKYYQQGYDDTVANCSNNTSPTLQYTSSSSSNSNSHDNHNQNSYNREQSQGQETTQKPICVTVFGSCNTTSGQAQNLQN